MKKAAKTSTWRAAGALILVLAPAASVWAGAAAPAAGTDWPQWGGPNRDGISTEKGWSTQWPAGGPKQLWKTEIGEGYSSLAVAGGKVYAMGNAEAKDTVFCLDAATGAVVWKYSYPCVSDRQYPGPRATPTVDGNLVYTFSRDGQLFCLDAVKGTEVWKVDAKKTYGAKPPGWGLASSPLVQGNLLIIHAGGLDATVVALDKAKGTLVWKYAGGKPGFSSPTPFSSGAAKNVACFLADYLVALDPASGKELWKTPWKTQYEVNAATPLFSGDKVFISSGYGRGCSLVQFGAGEPKTVWENKELCNHTSSCVLWQNCLYGFNGQINGKGALKCVDLLTGAAKWSQPQMMGSLILADGKLILLSNTGRLSVAEASPAGYTELAGADVLNGACWTNPVLSGGRIYCRNTPGQLVCVDVSGK